MMWTNIEKNSAVLEEGYVLSAYGFFRVVSLASMQIKSFEIPFPKQNPGLKLKKYIDPSAWPAGSVVRIKKKRPKGKIVLKKEIEQKKKETVQRNRKQRRRESNRVYLHVQATPWSLHHSHTLIWKINFVISKQFFSAIDAVWTWCSCIYHQFKYTFEEN